MKIEERCKFENYGERLKYGSECVIDRTPCKKHQNCYFKKLKQLKEENEELKTEIKDWIEQRKIAHNRYMKYQTKLEKIKEAINKYFNDFWLCSNCDIAVENKDCTATCNARCCNEIKKIIESEEENGK